MLPVINVDSDGVVYDFVRGMRVAFNDRGYKGVWDWPEPEHWQLHEDWPVTKAESFKVMYESVLEGRLFRHGRMVKGARVGLANVRKLGYHVRIVTNKTFTDHDVTLAARVGTLQWYADKKLRYNTIAFSDSAHGKGDFRADVIIDDKPTLEWMQPQALNILYHHPWNAHVNEDEIKHLVRAHTWDDVQTIVGRIL